MPSSMPDIANQTAPQTEGTLDWVGMNEIELPLMVALDDAAERPVSARIEALINLPDAKAKGIHMSRLFLLLDQFSQQQSLSYHSLQGLLEQFIISHEGLSDHARLAISFDYHLRRPALKSANSGWKAYPVTLEGELSPAGFSLALTVKIPYSSTCPCSAALARQLIQQAFDRDFAALSAGTASDSARSAQPTLSFDQVRAWLGSSEGIVATPHSQRSIATVTATLSQSSNSLPLLTLIDALEQALQTPVQSAVKREDEQEFARLNGQNLMFAEDAARRLQHAMNLLPQFSHYQLRVDHKESLHPHDAVAMVSSGKR